MKSPFSITAEVPLMTASRCGSRTSLRANEIVLAQLSRSPCQRRFTLAPTLMVSELPLATTALRSVLEYHPGTTAAEPGDASARKRANAAVATAANRKGLVIFQAS